MAGGVIAVPEPTPERLRGLLVPERSLVDGMPVTRICKEIAVGYDVRAKGYMVFKPGQMSPAAAALTRDRNRVGRVDEALDTFLGQQPNHFWLAGDCLGIDYSGKLTEEAESLASLIAPYVTSGEIRWEGEDGCRWRTLFSDGACDDEVESGAWW